MEEHVVRILETGPVTHNVKLFRVEKPVGYAFIPGQATEISVNTPELKYEMRPFTFTGLTSSPYLEFIIKRYPERRGVTDALHRLDVNDELILHDVFGELTFRGTGVFIAGGAGITPFISIFRNLEKEGQLKENYLIFGNKARRDIILEKELRNLLGDNFVNILSEEPLPDHFFGFIDEDLLKSTIKSFDTRFYVCGPPPMMDYVVPALKKLGASDEAITIEAM